MSQESDRIAAAKAETDKAANLFWFVKLQRMLPDWRKFLSAERHQYRTDVKALQCRGNLDE